MQTRLPEGSTLGVLGVGQLGRMFADAAHALGYRVHTFGPAADAPAVQVADEHTRAGYDDLDAVDRFARSVAVVTYEFENVPAATAAACAAHKPVLPGPHVLAVAQDRVREKTTLRDHGVAVGPFAPVGSERELRDAIARIGLPGVLKTAGGGYDGKGQRVLRSDADAVYGWEDLGRRPCIYEALIDFAQELSVVAARSQDGAVRCFGPIANTHRNHILDVSVLPAGVPQAVADEAVATATRIMAALDVVGVLCVEFFELREPTRDGNRVLVNELAPRPHNSGHLTIEACPASQFEQQVRAVAGLPLGDPTPKQPAAMVNLLGDLWPPGSSHSASGSSSGGTTEPDWSLVESDHLHLHLYGKTEPRPGRKMGHLTALARTPHEAIRDAVEARARLTPYAGLTPD
ncbi:MAG: 5-(carboxyamino)imidazole ribonucleotide synthase [Planctomycetota bacterium]